jgi:ankyrin repeat protein
LLTAVQQQDHALVARLLQLGADVDVPDQTGMTPVMLAAASGQIELLRTFLERSQQPGAVDHDQRSAAHHAVLAQQPIALELALTRTDEAAAAALIPAVCETGSVRMIRMVLERAPGGLEWSPGTRRALSIALAEHDAGFLRLLLQKHSAPPTVDGGTTPLLAHAVALDNTELFNALLAAGADPNTVVPTPTDKSFISLVKSENLRSYLKGDDGVTVLMIAAASGESEYVRALLDAGADRNRQTSRFKMLALYFAARTEKAKVVQMLLGRGPTPDELRVEISLAMQKASVLKNGVPILQTSISSGRKGFDTPPGEYVVTDKRRDHVSSIYKVPMPFFMRLNCRDFGLHAGAVPRYPASHGCIRLPADVAQKLFSEIPVGTFVTIN